MFWSRSIILPNIPQDIAAGIQPNEIHRPFDPKSILWMTSRSLEMTGDEIFQPGLPATEFRTILTNC